MLKPLIFALFVLVAIASLGAECGGVPMDCETYYQNHHAPWLIESQCSGNEWEQHYFGLD